MENFWDKKYSSKKYIYGTEPNTFLKTWINTQKPGNILFPAEGEGRNAVYAATLGWNVSAFDSSKEAKKKALLLAKENNVEIQYEISNAETYHSDKKFDVIVMIFTHFHIDSRSIVFKNTIKQLKPGGYLVIEVFSKDQVQHGTGGPKNEDLLYSLSELKEELKTMEIIKLEKLVRFLDEGMLHQGESDVIQLVAKR